jgi:hypothetical protein
MIELIPVGAAVITFIGLNAYEWKLSKKSK